MVGVFFVYSHRDEQLRDELETHLSMLKRERIIGAWHDRRIGSGKDIDKTISKEIEECQIILLLVSAYFLDSNYCYEIEMQRAMEKHEEGSARIIPVILRPCDWHSAPFGKLKAVPKDGKPVTKYADQHEAFLEIAQAVRQTAAELGAKSPSATPSPKPMKAARTASSAAPRSSNLRVKKEFSDRDKDSFLKDGFEYVANFFEGSLSELAERNSEINVDFTRTDVRHFSAAAYRNGKAVSRCRIWLNERETFSGGIAIYLGASDSDHSYHECLSVNDDGHSLFLRPMGMGFRRGYQEDELTYQGAAEYLWAMFIEALQR